MTAAGASPALRMDYREQPLASVLAGDDVLAVIGFGANAPRHDDPRYLRVALEPLGGHAPLEVWQASAPVARGTDALDDAPDVAWAQDGCLQFGAIEIDEDPALGDDAIERAAQASYHRLRAFTAARGYPHLLRIWNYLDGITAGDGDLERYRRFCVGRALGIGAVEPTTLPAATAIGLPERAHDGTPRRLQVYWLAAREPGTPLENPRQVAAYRYPRQYGPQPPSFARAMLPPGLHMPLLLSGTAAVVGHESRHAESVAAQLDETLANIGLLLDVARAQQPALPARLGAQSPLKVYVRDHDEVAEVARLLDAKLDPSVPRLLLHAAVCRRELRVEIDGSHGG